MYQLPLFKGAVPNPVVPELADNAPWEYLVSLFHSRRGIELLEPVSVLVRLVDT